ncbi:MAG TPA: AAA family ATPase, partial [Planctomicrobium sp.]|nr:AAA family ATPase [Planctomicrobium sp.]
NADPYSVFLLDEAEKAHPNVWKPFLNLFDEGWIVDQRGVKATADRAIFILTTNAGDRNIAQLTRSGKSTAEVTEQVKQTLAKVRHERSSQPVFPPAFLARIGRIVVFQPLDEQAMIGIAERVCTRMQRQWEQKRQTPLTFSQDAIESTGRKGHELNQQAHGREGGRIIRKLIAEELERQVFRSPEEALPS